MDAGLKISAVLHTVLIGAALFGGQIFRSEDRPEDPITTVTLLSLGEYAALTTSETDPTVQPPPVEEVEEAAAPTPPVQQLPQGLPEEGVAADQDQAGELRADEPTPDIVPEAADIISNEVNVQEDPIAQEAPVTQDATEVSEGENSPEPDQKATEQESTTTQIVTEADASQETGAPVKTTIPRTRPKSLLDTQIEQAVADEPAAQETPPPVETPSLDDLIAEQVEQSIQDAVSGNSDQGEVSSVPLSPVEANGLIFNIQRCWSVPIGGEGAANLRVVIGFDLSQDGFVEGLPSLVEPRGLATAGQQLAFEAARRAVLECQPYALPIEKYETWKKLEIEFDPQNMVNR